MRVNLAAQVLSASVAAVLRSFSPPDTAGTAKLCEMVDSLFDCLNVRSTSEHQRKSKPFLAPYSSLHDERWLEDYLLWGTYKVGCKIQKTDPVTLHQMLGANCSCPGRHMRVCKLLYIQ